MTHKIPFEDWQKVDMRVAKIAKAEDIENADNLYKLTLDVGEFGKRIVCAGIKRHYRKEELEGKKIVFLENLESRKIKGIVSEGMLLAASDEKGRVVLVMPEREVDIGSRIG
jgi:methionyl-tRNA synthetase